MVMLVPQELLVNQEPKVIPVLMVVTVLKEPKVIEEHKVLKDQQGQVVIMVVTVLQEPKVIKGDQGEQGPAGSTGIGNCFEHLAINSVAQNTAITYDNIKDSFILVPDAWTGVYEIEYVRIMTGFANPTQAVTFNLKYENVNGGKGTLTTVTISGNAVTAAKNITATDMAYCKLWFELSGDNAYGMKGLTATCRFRNVDGACQV